ncbi:hypothetical protein T265_01656 [Opisthorchis viverrini]|uniref:Uncharacterized protein n=1 Tax=Opisthorchis viverrini TaxID=6198 RepID=A0A075A1W4_OPIVI|nr:hypothetical protein T265_01656 [Opisthorchis viverrini]KER32222.1 hypothetical protein T265_01656 [Opisthorchis viverrini]
MYCSHNQAVLKVLRHRGRFRNDRRTTAWSVGLRTSRQLDDWGPRPKPSAQKPDLKVATSSHRCFSLQHEAQETVLVRPLIIDQPGTRDCDDPKDTPQYISMGNGGRQTVTPQPCSPR